MIAYPATLLDVDSMIGGSPEMRELVLLMAAVLGLGYYFSEGEPDRDFAGPIHGWHEEYWNAQPAMPGPVAHAVPE